MNAIFEALLARVTFYPKQTSISEEQRADIMKLAEEDAEYENRFDKLMKFDEGLAKLENRSRRVWRRKGFKFIGPEAELIKYFGRGRGHPSKQPLLLELLDKHFPVDRYPAGVPGEIKRTTLVDDIKQWNPVFHQIDPKTVRKAVAELNSRRQRDALRRARRPSQGA